jgi:hypothetical protein
MTDSKTRGHRGRLRESTGGGGRAPAPIARTIDEFRAEWARFFTEHGRRVWCEACHAEHHVDTSYATRRLRDLACTECGGRLRTRRWLEARSAGERRGD